MKMDIKKQVEIIEDLISAANYAYGYDYSDEQGAGQSLIDFLKEQDKQK